MVTVEYNGRSDIRKIPANHSENTAMLDLLDNVELDYIDTG